MEEAAEKATKKAEEAVRLAEVAAKEREAIRAVENLVADIKVTWVRLK